MKAHPETHQVENREVIVCCPPENVDVWNLHPRVYLALNEDGSVTCPYCGDIYTMDEQA